MMMQPRWLICLVFVVGCQASPDQPPSIDTHVDTLLQLMAERLEIMPTVVKAKHDLNLPIEDSKREEMLLQAIELDAKAQKLDPKFAKAFFTAQFAAAKKYQQEIQTTLPKAKGDEATIKAAELQMTDARKKISEINEKMLKVLVALNWETNAATIRPKITTLAPSKLATYSDAVRKLALEPLTD